MLEIVDVTKKTLHFAQQKGADFGKVEISGVKGILTKGEGEYDEDHPRFAFVRDRAGDGNSGKTAHSSQTDGMLSRPERHN